MQCWDLLLHRHSSSQPSISVTAYHLNRYQYTYRVPHTDQSHTDNNCLLQAEQTIVTRALCISLLQKLNGLLFMILFSGWNSCHHWIVVIHWTIYNTIGNDTIWYSQYRTGYLLNIWELFILSVAHLLPSVASYDGKILHAHARWPCAGHVLGFMFIGIVVMKIITFSKKCVQLGIHLYSGVLPIPAGWLQPAGRRSVL